MSALFKRPVMVKKMADENYETESVFVIESNELFPRLQESLYPGDGVSEIKALVKFSNGVLSLPQLNLELSGQLQVQCQRCLNSFTLPIQQLSQYLLFDNELALQKSSEQLGDKYETLLLDSIESSDTARHGELDLAGLVEDELLLSIPLYPKHENIEECSSDALEVKLVETKQEPETLTEKKQSPFSGLDKLLKDKVN